MNSVEMREICQKSVHVIFIFFTEKYCMIYVFTMNCALTKFKITENIKLFLIEMCFD